VEEALVSLVVSLLNGHGYRVRCEVPNMGQSVDIVATRGRWVTFVEAKIAHWRRALAQCEAHEQVADFICIALASASLSEEFLLIARQRGYGVIHGDLTEDKCKWVERPRINRKVWGPQRQYWARFLRMIDYAEH